MATATLATVLGAFSFSFAQKDDKNKIDAAKLNPVVSAEKGDVLTLLGTVMDPNGAVVPNVKLILRDRSKNIELKTVSDAEGKYSFPLIASGIYELTAEAPGFKKQRVENILIKTGTKTELNVELSIDGDAVFIGVVAADSLIEMSPEIKTVVTHEMLDRIPGRRLPF
jgi:protocatechuate 3,4-dioxygenase beta subunit